jgi:hypothetical protein
MATISYHTGAQNNSMKGANKSFENEARFKLVGTVTSIFGLAMTQAVSHRSLTAEIRVRA